MEPSINDKAQTSPVLAIRGKWIKRIHETQNRSFRNSTFFNFKICCLFNSLNNWISGVGCFYLAQFVKAVLVLFFRELYKLDGFRRGEIGLFRWLLYPFSMLNAVF